MTSGLPAALSANRQDFPCRMPADLPAVAASMSDCSIASS